MKVIFLNAMLILGLLVSSAAQADSVCQSQIKSLESEIKQKKEAEQNIENQMLNRSQEMAERRAAYPKELQAYEDEKKRCLAECAKERSCLMDQTAANRDEEIRLYKEGFESEMKRLREQYPELNKAQGQIHKERVELEGQLSVARQDCK